MPGISFPTDELDQAKADTFRQQADEGIARFEAQYATPPPAAIPQPAPVSAPSPSTGAMFGSLEDWTPWASGASAAGAGAVGADGAALGAAGQQASGAASSLFGSVEAWTPWATPKPPAAAPQTVGATFVDGRQQPKPRLQPGETVGDVTAVSGGGDLEAYARHKAQSLGIDPDVAARVANTEGGFADPIRQNTGGAPAYGPYQLYIGGSDNPGLGDAALQQGIDPRNPAHARAAIDFALEHAARNGWGAFQGAAANGIGDWEGINGLAATSSGTGAAGAGVRVASAGAPGATANGQTGEAQVTYRDQWGNQFTTPESKFDARPGGNSDVTVVSRTAAPATNPVASRQTMPQSGQTVSQAPTDDVAQSALDDPDKWALCGPVAAMIAAGRRGAGWTIAQAKSIATSAGLWDAGTGMHGLQSETDLLNRMGVSARTGQANEQQLAADAQAGNTPIISTNKHYFILTGYDPQTGKFDTSTTGTALRGGSRQLSLDEIAALGDGIQGAAYMDNPSSTTPSVVAPPKVSPAAAPAGGAAPASADATPPASADASDQWSPDGPASAAPAFSAPAGRGGGGGVMQRMGQPTSGPDTAPDQQPQSSYNDPTDQGTQSQPLPPQAPSQDAVEQQGRSYSQQPQSPYDNGPPDATHQIDPGAAPETYAPAPRPDNPQPSLLDRAGSAIDAATAPARGVYGPAIADVNAQEDTAHQQNEEHIVSDLGRTLVAPVETIRRGVRVATAIVQHTPEATADTLDAALAPLGLGRAAVGVDLPIVGRVGIADAVLAVAPDQRVQAVMSAGAPVAHGRAGGTDLLERGGQALVNAGRDALTGIGERVSGAARSLAEGASERVPSPGEQVLGSGVVPSGAGAPRESWQMTPQEWRAEMDRVAPNGQPPDVSVDREGFRRWYELRSTPPAEVAAAEHGTAGPTRIDPRIAPAVDAAGLSEQDLQFTRGLRVRPQSARRADAEYMAKAGFGTGDSGHANAGGDGTLTFGDNILSRPMETQTRVRGQADTVAHEVGHTIYSNLPEALQQEWESTIHPGGKDGFAFGRHLQGGGEVPPTGYAGENPAEDFADSFRVWRRGGVNPDNGEPAALGPQRQAFMQKVDEWLAGGQSATPTAPRSAGSGVLPSIAPGLRSAAYNGAQGAVLGAAGDDAQAQQQGREPTLGERVAAGATGAGLAMLAGNRGARGAVGRVAADAAHLVGSGMVPRGPNLETRLAGARSALDAIGSRLEQARVAAEGASGPAATTANRAYSAVRREYDTAAATVQQLQQAARDASRSMDAGGYGQPIGNLGHTGETAQAAEGRVGQIPRTVDDVPRDINLNAQAGPTAASGSDALGAVNATAGNAIRGAATGALTAAATDPGGSPQGENESDSDYRSRRAGEMARRVGTGALVGGVGFAAAGHLLPKGDGGALQMAGPQGQAQNLPPRVAVAVQRGLAQQAQTGLNPLQWTRKFLGQVVYSSIIGPTAGTAKSLGDLGMAIGSHPKEATRAIMRGAPQEYPQYVAGGWDSLLHDAGPALVDALAGRGQYGNHGGASLSSQTQNPIGKAFATAVEASGRLFMGVPTAIAGEAARGAAERLKAAQIATDAVRAGTIGKTDWGPLTQALVADAKAVRGGAAPRLPVTQDVIQAGEDFSKRQTFQNPIGPVGQTVRAAAGLRVAGPQHNQPIPLVSNFLAPVFGIPWNMHARMVEGSPIGLASEGVNLARGKGTNFDRMYDAATGSALVAGMAGLAGVGLITGNGPSDPQKRQEMISQGWQPYSTLVNGTYVPNKLLYSYWAPAANLAGDVHDAVAYRKPGTDIVSPEVGLDTFARFGSQLRQEAFLQPLADALSAVNPTSSASVGSRGAQMASSLIDRFVPYGSTLRAIGTSQDTVERAPDRGKNAGFEAQVAQRAAAGVGIRSAEAPAQDVLGRPVPNAQQGVAAVVGRFSTPHPDPVIQAFEGAGVDIPGPPPTLNLGKPSGDSRTVTQQIPMTPDEQRAYNTARGEGILRQITPELLASPKWQQASQTDRQLYLQARLRDADEYAKTQVQNQIGVPELRQRLGQLQKAS